MDINDGVGLDEAEVDNKEEDNNIEPSAEVNDHESKEDTVVIARKKKYKSSLLKRKYQVEQTVRKKRNKVHSEDDNNFKGYKVLDIYAINLSNDFDKTSLLTKLFKIKCFLAHKKKDSSFTHPKIFYKKFLIY